MKVREVIALGGLLMTCACGEKPVGPANATQASDMPKRRVALQDLIEQKKISYATAIQCMYLSEITKDKATNKEINQGIRNNAKFYALQSLQDNPRKIELDVAELYYQSSTAWGVYADEKAKQDHIAYIESRDEQEFNSICVPLFWGE